MTHSRRLKAIAIVPTIANSPCNQLQAHNLKTVASCFMIITKTGQLVKLPNDNKTIVNDYLSFFRKYCFF